MIDHCFEEQVGNFLACDYIQQELKLIQMLQTENKLGNSINLENKFNVGESQPT